MRPRFFVDGEGVTDAITDEALDFPDVVPGGFTPKIKLKAKVRQSASDGLQVTSCVAGTSTTAVENRDELPWKVKVV